MTRKDLTDMKLIIVGAALFLAGFLRGGGLGMIVLFLGAVAVLAGFRVEIAYLLKDAPAFEGEEKNENKREETEREE